MANEKKTEQFVRDTIRKLGFYDNNDIIIEESQSDNPTIKKALSIASKRGNGPGRPEFIITHKKINDIVILFECKAGLKFHRSENLDKYQDYAVDGVLLYGDCVSRTNQYHVICIAVSGEDPQNMKIDNYYYPKTSSQYSQLLDSNQLYPIQQILNFEDYNELIHFDKSNEKITLEKVLKCSNGMHNYIRDNIGLTEEQKPVFFVALLMALQDTSFATNFNLFSERDDIIGEKLVTAVEDYLKDLNKFAHEKVTRIINAISFIKTHEGLKSRTNGINNLQHCINEIQENILPFMIKRGDHDIVARFYEEFTSYTGGDGGGLGVILTPKHIKEFMAKLIGIDSNSILLDTCTGTGGFLITGKSLMVKDLDKKNLTKEEKAKALENIEKNNLIGVEKLDTMYTLFTYNMLINGVPEKNIISGDFFKKKEYLKSLNPTHALINPPYSQKANGLQEINFIYDTLDCLSIGGKLAVIVPLKVAIKCEKDNSLRETLLKHHRLDAVLSLNDQIFHPHASTVTCIMIFTAHIAHDYSPYHQTFFGYFKNDGFAINRSGRIDKGSWAETENLWLNLVNNKIDKKGISVNKQVRACDEWCAEAYMETDYSDLSDNDFSSSIKHFAGFKLVNSEIFEENDGI